MKFYNIIFFMTKCIIFCILLFGLLIEICRNTLVKRNLFVKTTTYAINIQDNNSVTHATKNLFINNIIVMHDKIVEFLIFILMACVTFWLFICPINDLNVRSRSLEKIAFQKFPSLFFKLFQNISKYFATFPNFNWQTFPWRVF